VTPSAESALPVTPLREYYDALGVLKEQEQTALAEAHAEDPRLLARRFRLSVEALEAQPGIAEPFYPPGRRDPPNPPTPVDEIKSTIEFASQLCDGSAQVVEGGPALSFVYVDRELSPLRTTASDRVARRSLDLLLANSDDRSPVLAELKIRADKPAYFAFVQVLMLAAELLVSGQRRRLKGHPPADNLAWSETGPFADLYLVAFEPPETGKYRERSFKATQEISKRLVADPAVASYIRRIAYLEAVVDHGGLAFENRFAFGAKL
jgi:hypothetical protein